MALANFILSYQFGRTRLRQKTSSSLSTFQVQQAQNHVKSSGSMSRGFPSPVVIPPTPVSTSQTPSSAPQTSYQDPRTSEEVSKEDETLKMLQRHYLQAILTLAPPHKLSVSCLKEIFERKYLILVSIKFWNSSPRNTNSI